MNELAKASTKLEDFPPKLRKLGLFIINSGQLMILKEACEHIAIPLSAMMAAIDPEVVILGNQNRKFYELMTPSLEKALEARLNGPASRNLKLEITREHSSLRGAAAYLMDLQFAAIN